MYTKLCCDEEEILAHANEILAELGPAPGDEEEGEGPDHTPSPSDEEGSDKDIHSDDGMDVS